MSSERGAPKAERIIRIDHVSDHVHVYVYEDTDGRTQVRTAGHPLTVEEINAGKAGGR
jgi:hypothetical protein